MRKKKNIIILDIETAGEVTKPLPYDIGWAIADRKGNIIMRRSFIVWEIFSQKELMESAYYAQKIPQYCEDLRSGKRLMAKTFTIRQVMLSDMEKYNVQEVFAYNCYFDRNGLNNLMATLTNGKYKYWFRYGVEFKCIWHMAAQVITTKVGYHKWCLKYGAVSDSGNVSTNAENVYRFIRKDPLFVEEHTGLEDVLIEYEILLECYKQKKKMKQGINRLCWQIPQKKFRATKEKQMKKGVIVYD